MLGLILLTIYVYLVLDEASVVYAYFDSWVHIALIDASISFLLAIDAYRIGRRSPGRTKGF